MAIDYGTLMTSRIRRILLVCSNYDSYALEEDGHIETQIQKEYNELGLTNTPSIVRAETTIEGLQIAKEVDIDLVITMYNVGEVDVFDFSKQFKEIQPNTPVVLLTSFSREVYKLLAKKDCSNIDRIFCWNNNTDLIIAIIKLFEDLANAESDIIEGGVRAILLVEDSIRYYSTYLPLLYKLVLQQNLESINDALNEKQQILRKRSRPKILMATCYDEATEIYNKYKNNMLGVISDIGFVVHRGDNPETEKIDAGIELCKMVKEDSPTLPFLLQSSQESMRDVAKSLGVGFVNKNSKTLTMEVGEYIEKEFGFGDFVVKDPETGIEIERAKNLYEFEKVLKKIPDNIYKEFASNNYLSRWLFARGLFGIGKRVVPIIVKDIQDVAEAREVTVKLLHEYRIEQGLGVVAQFDKETFNDAIWFSRLGNGSLGGKARGLAFLNHVLQKYDVFDKWEDVRVMVPKTLVITTEYFDKFINENGLQYVINSEISDEDILSEFVSSSLPRDLKEALKRFCHFVRKPLAIRSSSKLEDSHFQPFAGVYSTYMIPYVTNEDQMLRLLGKAIKSVYASVFFAAARGYITASANVLSEEKMGIVIQEICGSQEGDYYFPAISGVARSYNFYPVGHEEPEDGVCKIAYGLGKAVVDGDQVLRFSPKYPKHVLQTSTPELTMTDTQTTMYALNLHPEKFKTSIDDGVNLEPIKSVDCAQFESYNRVVSTWDFENQRIVDSAAPKGPKFITFAHILKYNSFPLAKIVEEVLQIAQKEVQTGVEMEFAVNLQSDPAIFNVLQVRQISYDSSSSIIDWDKIDTSDALLSSKNALGIGMIEGVSDIIYLKKENFDVMKTETMAKEISHLNAEMQKQGRNYVLIGFGRWGSSIPSLGVPVKWSDISEAKTIVECCLEDFRVDPSQGTHFFQNLTSFNVGYVNVNPYANIGDGIDFDALDAMEGEYESDFIRLVHFNEPLQLCVDGHGNRALIKK